jgi:predicted nucleic acid-binding protein
VALQSTLELEDAKDILYPLKSLIRRDTIKVVMFQEINMERVLQLAASEKLNFYDASYIAASEAVKAALATEDKELREKAGKYIDIIGYSDLRGRL